MATCLTRSRRPGLSTWRAATFDLVPTGTQTAGQEYVFIRETTPTTPIVPPTFTGLMEGATTMALSGTQTGYYSYKGGLGGNSFTLAVFGDAVFPGSGNFTLELDGTDPHYLDLFQGTNLVDRRLLASLTGYTVQDDDTGGPTTLTVDFTKGFFTLPNGVTFTGSTTKNDELTVTGDKTFSTVTDTQTAAGAGNVLYDTGLGSTLDIHYSSVDTTTQAAVTLTGNTVGTLKFVSGAAIPSNTLTLKDDGHASNDISEIVSAEYATVDFQDPTTLLQVNGASTDTINLSTLDSKFDGAVTLDGGSSGTVSVSSIGASGATLTGLTIQNAGSASLNDVTTGSGGLSVSANTIDLFGGTIDTTAGGDVSLTGSVTLQTSAAITTAGGGNVDLSGATIDDNSPGAETLSIDAGTGLVTLADVGIGTALGALSVTTTTTGSTNLTGDITTQGDVTLIGTVTLSNDVTITSNGGNVDLSAATVDDVAAGTDDLTIDAGSGLVTLDNVGTGTALVVLSVTTTGVGSTSLHGDIQTRPNVGTGDVTLNGAVTLASIAANVTITSNGGHVDLANASISDATADTHDLAIDASGGAVDLGAIGSGALNAVKGLNVQTGGAVAVHGAILAGTDGVRIGSSSAVDSIVVDAGSLGDEEIQDTTPGAAISLNATNNIQLNDFAIASAGDVILTSTGGAIVDAAADSTNKITTPGTLTIIAATGVGGIGGNAEIDTAVGTLDVTNSTSGDIGIAQTGTIDVKNLTQTAAGDISLTASGTIDVLSTGSGVNAQSGSTISLTATGSDSDVQIDKSVNGDSVNILAGGSILGSSSVNGSDLILNAGGDIGSSGTKLATQVSYLDVTGDGVFISNAGSLTLKDLNTDTYSGKLDGPLSEIDTTGGTSDLTIQDIVSVTGTATFNAGHDLMIDTANQGVIDLSLTTIDLIAGNDVTQTGTVDAVLSTNLAISAGGSVNLHTSVGTLAVSAGSTVDIVNDSSSLAIGTVTPPSGAVVGITARGAASVANTGDLTVSDTVSTTGGSVTLTGGLNELSGPGVTITLDAAVTGTSTVSVQGGAGDDTFIVNTTGSSVVNLDGQGGSNNYTVNLDSTFGSVDTVSVSNTGSTGINALTVNDTNDTNPQIYAINGSAVSSAIGTVDYASGGGLENVSVNGGSGSDTFDVTPDANNIITFNINGNAPTPPPPASPGDTLIYRATGLTGITDNGSTITATGVQPVNYTDIETVQITGTSSTDVTVEATGDHHTLQFFTLASGYEYILDGNCAGVPEQHGNVVHIRRQRQ